VSSAGEASVEASTGALNWRHARRYNLRDYGGYAAADGGRLKLGRLFRSGQLDLAAPEDAGLVQRLGVDIVVDLRGPAEIAPEPPAALTGYVGRIIRAGRCDDTVPHALGGLAGLSSISAVNTHMCAVYRLLPGSPRFVESLEGYFGALASAEGATLIHCFAGKDRTGLAVALFHLAMGVPHEAVVSDYLMTNLMGEARVEAGVTLLRRQAPPATPDWIIREAMAVREDYLAAAFSAIRDQFQSPLGYLKSAIGLDARAIGELKDKFLA
jgi:protein tyrosine/serine phosphatase